MNKKQPPERPCECLIGLRLDGGWHVKSFVNRPLTATGGNFSVGYLVEDKDGHEAYLKALDFSAAFQSVDFTRELQNMTAAYNFERDILDKCKSRKFNRVVVPITDGWVQANGNFGGLGRVAYLIFPFAEGDIRKEVGQWKAFDVAWMLRTLHQSATGLNQLHSAGIAHQDLKPSNILVFPQDGSKVSDLGRASHSSVPSAVDSALIPGDVGYAPPEQWYGWRNSPDFSTRFVADLYLLGSLIFFFFLNCSATAALNAKIAEKHSRDFGRSNFTQDLPYIQYAFAEVIGELRVYVEEQTGDLAGEIVMIANQLCEPDPRRRGDPRVLKAAHVPPYDLNPYISRFDRLAKIAERRMV